MSVIKLAAVNDAPAHGPSVPELDASQCFIVDDDPGVCIAIDCLLRAEGIRSQTFSNCDALLAGLSARVPALIFLDLALKKSDAIEVIRALAARRYQGAVQLISGSPGELLQEVRRIGDTYGLRMLPVMRKPFGREDVKAVIAAHALQSPKAPSCTLEEALQQNWVELWYQPKIDLRSNKVSGAEALARIHHPDHGVLNPAAFLPNASSDALLSLAEFAIGRVFRDLAYFAGHGRALHVSVNVPVEALHTLSWPSLIRGHGQDLASRLILEVTEDQMVRNVPLAREIAAQLRICGISLSIDDFGAGYSSLARLKEFPFNELKLDRSLVTGCGSDAANAAICETAITLAHKFNSIAVAEGVEDRSDLEALRAMGCDAVQGFVFSAALPRDAFASFAQRPV
jgi:EAL domain-containing protein (putative c-di-GMP-specific phosphodiesterase class I)